MKLMYRLFIVASLLLTGLAPLFAQKELRLPPGVQKITSVEGITEYALPNGLRVLLFPDASKPIITVNVTYKVGSRHEGYGETGMAHLLEHLVFKGTPKHPNIPQELSEHGARPNGTTSFDRTNYFETFDATEENLRWALDLESDRMVNSYIAKKDLESEMTVVRNEYERGENDPGSVLYKRMLAAVFQWHNYGHSTIGEKSDIEQAPIERLQAFYHNYYQPDNAVLVVAGKIDEQKTLDLVVEYFGKIPKPERQIIPTYTREPIQDGGRVVTLRRTGEVQVYACMFRTPAGSHPDYAPLAVLASILTDEPSGRLYKSLVDTKKAVSVSGNASGFAEGGILAFFADARKDQSIEEVQNTLLAGLEDLKKNPPTAEEVEKAKTRMLKNWEMFFKSSDRVGLNLSNYIGYGDWRLIFLYRDNLEKVTAEDVNRVYLRYVKADNRTEGFFYPEANPNRADVPDVPDIAALLKDYKGKPPIAQGEDFDPNPENIEKRTLRSKLPNGMKYALLSKENRGDAVNASFTFRFGTPESLRGKATAAGYVPAMLDKGTTTMNRQQIKEELDRLKARVSFFGGAGSLTISIETDREHLPATIRLVGEMLRKPAFDPAEFDKLKTEQLAALEEQKNDPNTLANVEYARLTDPGRAKDDPRYTMTIEEEIAATQALTIEQVRDFYKSFYGGNEFSTGAIVGDFDNKEAEKAMNEAFGNWKSPAKYVRLDDPYVAATTQSKSIETPDKANASYVAGYNFAMRNDDPEYPAVAIGGYIIGGGFLNSRLATRIRQKDGLSYTVRGSFSASPLDKNASFNAFMIYNPENLGKLETAFREEIERVTNEGFTAEELASAKSGWLKSRKVNRTSDASLAGTLSSYLFYGRDMNWDKNFEQNVENLTLEQVNAAMKKHLDYSKIISVKAGDFKKAAKP
ncbi:MAG: insulinase family protein [Saprospiraceae bacterium]|nr:insulinase family protein [Saprospiraceae bacterium]